MLEQSGMGQGGIQLSLMVVSEHAGPQVGCCYSWDSTLGWFCLLPGPFPQGTFAVSGDIVSCCDWSAVLEASGEWRDAGKHPVMGRASTPQHKTIRPPMTTASSLIKPGPFVRGVVTDSL